MSASITFDGLDELREALRRLPEELAAEASGIVLEAARDASSDIEGAYPERTGNLKHGLFIFESAASKFGAGAVLKNRAQHAYMFEYGTQARHNAIGANRGSMPPGNVFIPRVLKHRRRMYERLKAMLVRHGATVSGEP